MRCVAYQQVPGIIRVYTASMRYAVCEMSERLGYRAMLSVVSMFYILILFLIYIMGFFSIVWGLGSISTRTLYDIIRTIRYQSSGRQRFIAPASRFYVLRSIKYEHVCIHNIYEYASRKHERGHDVIMSS